MKYIFKHSWLLFFTFFRSKQMGFVYLFDRQHKKISYIMQKKASFSFDKTNLNCNQITNGYTEQDEFGMMKIIGIHKFQMFCTCFSFDSIATSLSVHILGYLSCREYLTA